MRFVSRPMYPCAVLQVCTCNTHTVHNNYACAFQCGREVCFEGWTGMRGQPQAAVLMVSRGVAARDLGLMISYKFESNTKLSRVSGG